MLPREWTVEGRTLRLAAATIGDILPLRQRVLRIGLTIEDAKFSGDEESTTLHAAAFDHLSAISCATLMRNEYQGQTAWQLRGMATDFGWQGKGVGAALLKYLIEWAVVEPPLDVQSIKLFWCNARVPAIPFYERLGWKVVSKEFDIPTAGPHRRMIREP